MNASQPIEATGPASAVAFAVLVAALRTIKPKKRTEFLEELCRELYFRNTPTAAHPAVEQARRYLLWATPRARKAVGMPESE